MTGVIVWFGLALVAGFIGGTLAVLLLVVTPLIIAPTPDP